MMESASETRTHGDEIDVQSIFMTPVPNWFGHANTYAELLPLWYPATTIHSVAGDATATVNVAPSLDSAHLISQLRAEVSHYESRWFYPLTHWFYVLFNIGDIVWKRHYVRMLDVAEGYQTFLAASNDDQKTAAINLQEKLSALKALYFLSSVCRTWIQSVQDLLASFYGGTMLKRFQQRFRPTSPVSVSKLSNEEFNYALGFVSQPWADTQEATREVIAQNIQWKIEALSRLEVSEHRDNVVRRLRKVADFLNAKPNKGISKHWFFHAAKQVEGREDFRRCYPDVLPVIPVSDIAPADAREVMGSGLAIQQAPHQAMVLVRRDIDIEVSEQVHEALLTLAAYMSYGMLGERVEEQKNFWEWTVASYQAHLVKYRQLFLRLHPDKQLKEVSLEGNAELEALTASHRKKITQAFTAVKEAVEVLRESNILTQLDTLKPAAGAMFVSPLLNRLELFAAKITSILEPVARLGLSQVEMTVVRAEARAGAAEARAGAAEARIVELQAELGQVQARGDAQVSILHGELGQLREMILQLMPAAQPQARAAGPLAPIPGLPIPGVAQAVGRPPANANARADVADVGELPMRTGSP